MKNTVTFIFWLLILSIFSYTSAANLEITHPTSGEVVGSQKYTFKWNCDSTHTTVELSVIHVDNWNWENATTNCTANKFEVEIDLQNLAEGNLEVQAQQATPPSTIRSNPINFKKNLWRSPIWSGTPSEEALKLKDDNRVCSGELCHEVKDETSSTAETSKKSFPPVSLKAPVMPTIPTGLSKTTTDTEKKVTATGDEVEVTLPNGNKFTHKKMTCDIIDRLVRMNLESERNTTFRDALDSKYYTDIAALEEVWVIVWTSKNTFEPKREVTKSELLWIALKANCYDLSGNTRENWQERTVWIAVWDNILSNSNIWVNEKITKAEAYEYMLKAGKVKTPKSSNTEAMKYLGVIGEDENDESTTLPREKAASIILKLIRLYNK